MPLRWMPPAVLLLVALAPGGARAIDPHSHAETLLMVDAPLDVDEVSGLELMGDASFMGVGLGLGMLWERLAPKRHALSGNLELQLRPDAWIGLIRNRWVFPHLETGFTVGTILDKSPDFRRAYFLGAGAEVRAWPGPAFPVLTIGWRWTPALRSPADAPSQVLLMGLGFRWNDEG